MTKIQSIHLLRTRNLKSFQQAIASLIRQSEPKQALSFGVLVPSRAAAEQLRKTVEELLFVSDLPASFISPEIFTREEWYRAMHEHLKGKTPPLLSYIERQVCFLAAAREVSDGSVKPPFQLRPGLVPSIVNFYDALMRQKCSIDDFERRMLSELEPSADLDRGARRLLQQTRFLVATFRSYQKRVAETGRLDEHELRHLLVENTSIRTFTKLVITVADHVGDPEGLWPADFDLLTRLFCLKQIYVVSTEAILKTGFHERLIRLLPAIVEQRIGDTKDKDPIVLIPESGDHSNHFVWRDREEELLGIVRRIKSRVESSVRDINSSRLSTKDVDKNRALTFHRPLPYLYLAHSLFKQSGISFEAKDGLPLAAEPYAASVAIVCDFVASNYSRVSVIELLKSPHFQFDFVGKKLESAIVEAFDKALTDVHYNGGRSALARLAADWNGNAHQMTGSLKPVYLKAAPVAAVASKLAEELKSLESEEPAQQQLEILLKFLIRHQAEDITVDAQINNRESRARDEILKGIQALAKAHSLLDKSPTSFTELVFSVRRWIENQTFTPISEKGGLQIVDSRTASYGRFHELFIVGLVEGDWPERLDRNIFYPNSLLIPLGWPREHDRLLMARARFVDLVRLPLNYVSLSRFSLENDAVVTQSSFLEETTTTGLRTISETGKNDELLSEDASILAPLKSMNLKSTKNLWLRFRMNRPDRKEQKFHGTVGKQAQKMYAVKTLEQYRECPFKYFAGTLLQLGEESVDEHTLTPLQRGKLLHSVLEKFFLRWEQLGEGAITIEKFHEALSEFHMIAKKVLALIPASERPIAHAWLLGSAATPGIAERLFMLEINQPTEVVERLIEYSFNGSFVFRSGDCKKVIQIRGVTDRIDLFSDGTFRIIDYKANRAPNRDQALQLPVYARCAEQQLEGYQNRFWRVRDAAYIAFGSVRLNISLAARDFAQVITKGEELVIDTVNRIERGEYPPRPIQLRSCNTCPYPTVCRKDYVGEE